MKKSIFFCVACSFLTLVFATPTYGQIFALTASPSADPHRQWKVLETEHFEIIYDGSQKTLAETVAAEAERADLLLQPLLGVHASGKIPIALTDITDSSNGAATGFPRPSIVIYPVLPAANDVTSEYADWIREVVTHEYTHVLNFEPTSGILGVIRTIFGSIWKPNSYLPRWYTEGLAVEMESRLTPVGRGRSHYYAALARAFFELDEWGSESIDRINSTAIPTWPRGQRPYYFGYLLVHELSELKNSDKIYGILNHRFGARFPWFINGPVEDNFGGDFEDLLKGMYERKRPTIKSEMDLLQSQGAQNGKALYGQGYNTFSGKISPDGLKLAAVFSEYNKDQSIRVWTRKSTTESFASLTENPKIAATGKEIHGLNWRADSKNIIFDRLEKFHHFNSYSDLIEVNIESEDENRLTEGARAREGAVMADNSIVFVKASPTQTSLVSLSADGKNMKLLYAAPDGERVSSPAPYLDGIIYSHRDKLGHEWIERLPLNSNKPIALTKVSEKGELQIMPSADRQNPGAFYFSGSHSGVVNIYRSENSVVSGVTNVTTYANSPEIDYWSKEIIFSRLTGHGIELESLPLKLDTPTTPPQLTARHGYGPAEEATAKSVATEEHNYHGMAYLWPQYWLPFVNFVPGGSIFSIDTSASDPLGHHQFDAEVGYDTRAQQLREIVDYTNLSLPFYIDAVFANDYEYLAGSGTTEHIIYGAIDTRHFLQKHENNWKLSPSFSYKMTDYPGLLFTEVGPGIQISYSNITSKKDYQISPESGFDVSAGYNYYLPGLGNTSYGAGNLSGDVFLAGKPLPPRNVIKFNVATWVSPPQGTILTGTRQGGGEYGGFLFNQSFLVRGYPYGEFIGSTLLNAGFEYRFPLGYPFSGPGTLPIFLNSWHGAVVADAITLEGGFYDSSGGSGNTVLRATRLGNNFGSAGVEIKGDFQLFYFLPVTLKLGYYYGFTQRAFGGSSYFLGFSSVL